MEAGIFSEISLIFVIVTAITMLVHFLRQPLIVGYILTGLLVGPSAFNLVHSTETIQLFSHLGVALLLFIIGLGLNPRVIREVGKVAFLTGMGQITFTSLIGFLIARALGFAGVEALYISVALSFSSTIIILKLLSDQNELSRLHGKIATGFLLVQDLVAVILLVIVSSLAKDASITGFITQTVIKGGLFGTALTLLAIYVLPKLGAFFAKSQEVLFVFSIGWGLGIAALCTLLGFSVEIGALAAGVALAASPYSYEISSRMKPLRDFFLIIFFIVLGAGMTLGNLSGVLLPALIFSAFILVGNPIIVMCIMGVLGYRKQTSFKAGLVVAQISEFSLILLLMGVQVGQVSDKTISMMTLIGIITIAGCTYMMIHSQQIYAALEKYLAIFERKNIKEKVNTNDKHEIILFGFKGGSHNFLDAFKKLGKSYLVIDYNPETIDQLQAQGVRCRYGDANDPEFLEELELDGVKLVIMNLTDFEANRLVLNHVRYHNQRTVVISMTKSDKVSSALELYEKGATYVMMPHYLGSSRISNIIRSHGLKPQSFTSLRKRHTKYLLKHNI